MKTMNFSKIVASINHGPVLTKVQLRFLYFALGLSFVMPILSIIFIAVAATVNELKASFVDGTIPIFLAVSLFALCLGAAYLYLIVKNNKLKKQIQLWLEDAVELKAYSRKVSVEYYRIGFLNAKIQVEFSYGKKTYIKESKGGGIGVNGHFYLYRRYADRTVSILYSPKYDELLLLKDR